MTYKLLGEWNTHPEYGRQFNFSRYEAVKPKDTSGIYKYLVRVCRWIGPATASALVDIYGDQTLEVLRNDPDIVAAEIKGITESRAKEIQKILINMEEEESILVELMDILDIPGLRKSLPYELIEKFGSNAAKILLKNPYVITQFYGSGFLIADRLALQRCKIPPNSMFRAKAAIMYAMEQDLNGNGNTWIPAERLIQDVVGLTSIQDLKKVQSGIDELLALEAIVEILDNEYSGYYSLWEVNRDESYIAARITEMQ
uniref:Putative helicase n=1 Tax=viral metagenome TaxID=1070528 RepID=A0A6M3K1Q0_9ZZZZ